MPALASVALAMVGFCSDEAKASGPVDAYVTVPATVGVNSAMVEPSQYGPPLVGAGVAADVLTTTVVLPASEAQSLVVTITEYAPASAAAAVGRVGLWAVE